MNLKENEILVKEMFYEGNELHVLSSDNETLILKNANLSKAESKRESNGRLDLRLKEALINGMAKRMD